MAETTLDTLNQPIPKKPHQIVIIGGGFGGLFAARALGLKTKNPAYEVTLMDKRNFHLFQPLLYQVATGSLTVGDIATPLRVVLRKFKNIRTLMSTAYDLDVKTKTIRHEHGMLNYDTLIVATGVKHHYFGKNEWLAHAPGLKTVEHALDIRRRVFNAFEMAELESDPIKRKALMTFVIVGAGPTGVELAGAIGEMAQRTMVQDFRAIDSRQAKIILLEGAPAVLPVYPPKLQNAAQTALAELGVSVHTQALVQNLNQDHVEYKQNNQIHTIQTKTILWAAGVKSSAFGELVRDQTGVETTREGKLKVNADLSLPNYPEIFVVGDLAAHLQADGKFVPGMAQGAIQGGQFVAKLLKNQLLNKKNKNNIFKYNDLGSMAVIGRNRAVGDLGKLKITGFTAWFLWVVIHIRALIDGEQRLTVMTQWLWRYLTRKTGDRLITGKPPNTAELQAKFAEQKEMSAMAREVLE